MYFVIHMNHIVEPNEHFDFLSLRLTHPLSLNGGAYFTKLEYASKPLYIQTSRSFTRQGIVKSGKKYYCDLMFDQTSETFINWVENLEETCKKLLYEKRNDWFQGNLEESDIDNAFNPLLRIYKSGKYSLLRVNVKSKDDAPYVRIYDENEQIITHEDIHPDTEVMSLLEIQGIKFTSRNFQMEMEMKQMMVVKDDEQMFANCLIRPKGGAKATHIIDASIKAPPPPPTDVPTFGDDHEKTDTPPSHNIDLLGDVEQPVFMIEEPEQLPQTELVSCDTEQAVVNDPIIDESAPENIVFEDLTPIEEPVDETGLREVVDADLEWKDSKGDPIPECITLKKPNQVYHDLYREARNKAKAAKKRAILAYLEAKHFKKTYMVDDLCESESDIDADIDEVSESELEGLEEF